MLSPLTNFNPPSTASSCFVTGEDALKSDSIDSERVEFTTEPLLFCSVIVTWSTVIIDLALILPSGNTPGIVIDTEPSRFLVIVVLLISLPSSVYSLTCALFGTLFTLIDCPDKSALYFVLKVSIEGVVGFTLNNTLTGSTWPLGYITLIVSVKIPGLFDKGCPEPGAQSKFVPDGK